MATMAGCASRKLKINKGNRMRMHVPLVFKLLLLDIFIQSLSYGGNIMYQNEDGSIDSAAIRLGTDDISTISSSRIAEPIGLPNEAINKIVHINKYNITVYSCVDRNKRESNLIIADKYNKRTINDADHFSISHDCEYMCYTQHRQGEMDTICILRISSGKDYKLVKELRGTNGTFSPRRNMILFNSAATPTGCTNVMLYDLRTGNIRKIQGSSQNVGWSPKGDKIITCENNDKDGYEEKIDVLAFDSSSFMKSYKMVSPRNPILSPSEKYFAVESHLSRPLTGHMIINMENNNAVKINYDMDSRAPFILSEWSNDEKWLLIVYRIPDPVNNGTWMSDEIWLVSFDGKYKYKVTDTDRYYNDGLTGVRGICRFIEEDKCIIWINKKGELYAAKINSIKKKTLLACKVNKIIEVQ